MPPSRLCPGAALGVHPELVEAQEGKQKRRVCFVLGAGRACWHFCFILLAKASHMAEPKVRDRETYLTFVGGISKSYENGHGYREAGGEGASNEIYHLICVTLKKISDLLKKKKID